ncbi:MAG: hypothetical protein JWO13_2287 [Acidobacteriales bacterium]|nr:hypothetical protein [Terriglobales bacterium]
MANNVEVTLSAKNDTAAAFAAAEQSIHKLEQTAEAAKHVLEALAIVEVARKMLEFAEHTFEAEANLAKMAQRTGVNVEQLSELAYAANLSGVGVDVLEKGIKKLQNTLAGAAEGNTKAIASLKAVGVNARDAQGHVIGAADALELIAQKFAATKDGTEKAALAMQIFGARTGTQLIPLLDKGKDGIAELREEAHRLGVVLTEEDAEAAEHLEQNMKRLQAVAQGLTQHFLTGLTPELNKLATAMTGPGVDAFDAMERSGKSFGEFINKVAYVIAALRMEMTVAAPKIAGFAEMLQGAANGNPFAAASGFNAMLLDDTAFAKAQLEELGRFANKLFDEPPASKHEKHTVPPPELLGKEVNSDEDQLQKQLAKNKMELAKAAAEQIKAFNAIELASNENLYKHELISVQEYFKKKKELQLADAAAEESGLRLEIQAAFERDFTLQKEIAALNKKGDTHKEVKKKELESAQIEEKLIQLNEKLTVSTAKLNALQNKRADGSTDPLLEKADAMERYAAEAGRMAERINNVFSLLDENIARVTTAEKNHELTGTEAENKINDLRDQAAYKLDLMVSKYKEMADASGDPKLVDNASKYERKLDELGKKINWVRDAAIDSLQNDTESLFANMISGSKSAADAFADFARSIISDMSKIIAKMIAMSLLQKLLGFFGLTAGGRQILNVSPEASANGTGQFGDFLGGMGSFGIPGRAGGGHQMAGELGWVGEEGPELWIPDQAGTVVPMSKAGGMGGGMTIYNDFTNADPGSEQRIDSKIQAMGLWARDAAVFKVHDIQRRKV